MLLTCSLNNQDLLKICSVYNQDFLDTCSGNNQVLFLTCSVNDEGLIKGTGEHELLLFCFLDVFGHCFCIIIIYCKDCSCICCMFEFLDSCVSFSYSL